MLYFTKFYSFDIKKFLGIAISELNQNESFFSILHQKIVILGLKKIQLRDCNWEILLTKIRKDIARIQTESTSREKKQGLAKNGLKAQYRKTFVATNESEESGGNFLQDIADKLS